jgi:hypothetical protein
MDHFENSTASKICLRNTRIVRACPSKISLLIRDSHRGPAVTSWIPSVTGSKPSLKHESKLPAMT